MDEWANLVEKERSQGLLKTAEPLDVGRLINYDEENTNPHLSTHMDSNMMETYISVRET